MSTLHARAWGVGWGHWRRVSHHNRIARQALGWGKPIQAVQSQEGLLLQLVGRHLGWKALKQAGSGARGAEEREPTWWPLYLGGRGAGERTGVWHWLGLGGTAGGAGARIAGLGQWDFLGQGGRGAAVGPFPCECVLVVRTS